MPQTIQKQDTPKGLRSKGRATKTASRPQCAAWTQRKERAKGYGFGAGEVAAGLAAAGFAGALAALAG
jgi:hypothetical protein